MKLIQLLSHYLWYFHKFSLHLWYLLQQALPAVVQQPWFNLEDAAQTVMQDQGIVWYGATVIEQGQRFECRQYLSLYCTESSFRVTFSSDKSALTAGGTPSTSTACS